MRIFREPDPRTPLPSEHSTPADPSLPDEHPPLPDEFNDTLSGEEQTEEQARNTDRSFLRRKARRKTLMKSNVLLQIATAVVAVIIVKDSFGIDLLGSDIFAREDEWHHHHEEYYPDEPDETKEPYETEPPVTEKETEPPETEPPETEDPGPVIPPEEADESFPSLSNLEPNGEVPGYGILNEEYILFESEGEEPRYLVLGTARRPVIEVNIITPTTVNGAVYDSDTNTLTLTNFTGNRLETNLMGNSFTIKLVGKNKLDQITVHGFHYGGSVTITGTGSLTVNQSKTADYGILLDAEFSQSCLMVDSGVTLDVYGAKASVMVRGTSAANGIRYLYPLSLSEGIRKQGDFAPLEDGTYASAQEAGYTDETIVSSGKPLARVTFSRLTQIADSKFPKLQNLAPNGSVPDNSYTGGGVKDEQFICFINSETSSYYEETYLVAGSNVRSAEIGTVKGATYSAKNNTLTLKNVTADLLRIHLMGNGLKINLVGKNTLNGIIVESGFYAGSITFTGTGSLTVNKNKSEEYGILLECSYAKSCLMVGGEVTLDVYGQSRAILVRETTAGKGIYYTAPLAMNDGCKVLVGEESPYSLTFVTDSTGQRVVDGYCHDDYIVSGERQSAVDHVIFAVPAEHGDTSFVTLPNPDPNGYVDDYGVTNEQYVRFSDDSEDRYLVIGTALDGSEIDTSWYPDEVEGAVYDEETNTLTLTDCIAPILNVNLMGNGFTIRLVGDNRLDRIQIWGFQYGGSVTITGNGSLTVNRDETYPVGILLNAEYSETCLMIDSGVIVDVYGSEAAVVVADSSEEKGIYYLSPLTLTGGRRTASEEEAFTPVEDLTVLCRTFTVTDENDTNARHVTFSSESES